MCSSDLSFTSSFYNSMVCYFRNIFHCKSQNFTFKGIPSRILKIRQWRQNFAKNSQSKISITFPLNFLVKFSWTKLVYSRIKNKRRVGYSYRRSNFNLKWIVIESYLGKQDSSTFGFDFSYCSNKFPYWGVFILARK